MIWPFSASSKQLALSEPAIPYRQVALQMLADFKSEVLELEFIHSVAEDAITRGRFSAVMDRMLALVSQLELSDSDGKRLIEVIKSQCGSILSRLRGAELASSFTAEMEKEGTYTPTAFSEISRNYGWMRTLQKRSAEAIEAAPDQQVRITFPDYTSVTGELREQLDALSAAWQVRAEQELSVEDRYLVDTLATSYLPESIRLYASLSKDSAFAAQAKQMLAQQLELFAERLSTIENFTAARNMQAMVAHNAFLQERLRPEPEAAERLSIAR